MNICAVFSVGNYKFFLHAPCSPGFMLHVLALSLSLFLSSGVFSPSQFLSCPVCFQIKDQWLSVSIEQFLISLHDQKN